MHTTLVLNTDTRNPHLLRFQVMVQGFQGIEQRLIDLERRTEQVEMFVRRGKQ